MAATITVNSNTFSSLRDALARAGGTGATVRLTRDVIVNDTGGWSSVNAGNLILDGAGYSIGSGSVPLGNPLFSNGTTSTIPIENLEVRNVNLHVQFTINSRYIAGFCPIVDNSAFINCSVNGEVGSSMLSTSDIISGGFVSYAIGVNTFDRCVNRCLLTVDPSISSAVLGGIVGNPAGGSCIITNCRNEADLGSAAFSGSLGGIIGETAAAEQTTIDCVNTGRIDASVSQFSLCGGITGRHSNEKLIMRNCVNYGEINAQALGGVSGVAMGLYNCEVSGCRNTAAVSLAYGGGVLGSIIVSGGDALVARCSNSGPVNLAPGGNTTNGVGGIIGSVDNIGSATGRVIECRNLASLSMGASDYGIGGICGVVGLRNEVVDCVNERQVEAGGNVGGIVGRANGLVNSYDTSVRGCVNRGAVYGVGGNVGGIVGNASETVIISECLALGTARSNEGPVGGIVGIVNYRCDIGGNIAMQSAVTVEDITLDVRARTPGRDYIHRVVGRVVNTFPYNNFLHGNYANPNMIVTGSNDLLDDVYDYDHFLNPSMQDLDYPGVEVRTDDPNYGLNRMQGQNLEPCAYGPNAYNCFRAISPNNACAMNQYARYLKCVGFGAPRGVKDIAMLWDMYLDYMSPCCSRGGKVVLIGVYRAATVPAAGITYQLYRVLPDGSREPAGLGVADSNGVIEFDNLPPGEYVARIVNTGSGVRDYSIYRITVDGRYQVTVREERLA